MAAGDGVGGTEDNEDKAAITRMLFPVISSSVTKFDDPSSENEPLHDKQFTEIQ